MLYTVELPAWPLMSFLFDTPNLDQLPTLQLEKNGVNEVIAKITYF